MEVGTKINGRYKIISLIGSGGMAKVYRAHDLILDRDVAVKVLRFDFQDDQAAIRRFQREALAATELIHPNVVAVYDVGEDYGMQYIVMEYVRGTDLKQYIKQNNPISFDKVVDIMQQILSAVSLAHRHRIIHRDLKPQNILIDGAGNCKITDFGIAIALSETSITQTNTLLGSVHYLSPEQARGSMATPQSDIYALGIMLYELLTGKVPFDGESAVSIALKHFQSEIPSIREQNPNVPQALENVVRHATAKDPKDRYQTADDMAEDLSTVLSAGRVNEAVWEPTAEKEDMLEATKVIPTIPKEVEPQPEKVEEEPPVNESKKKKKKKRRKWPWILLLLLLLLGGGYLLFGQTATIPSVSGKSVSAAESALRSAGFKVGDTTYQYSNQIAKNKVIDTNPKEDTKQRKGKTIDLIVSKGTDEITIGNYVGMSYEAAVDKLVKAGMDKSLIKKEEQVDYNADKGTVIAQSIASGKVVDGSKEGITLTVSSGSNALTMKNLKGMSEGAVRRYLSKNQLTLVPQYEYSASVKAGKVIAQDPAAGTKVQPGDSIFVTFSQGDGSSSYSQPQQNEESSSARSSEKEEASQSEQSSESVASSEPQTSESQTEETPASQPASTPASTNQSAQQ